MELKAYLADKKRLVDSFLESHFSGYAQPSVLNDSVVYSLSAGGKRIRPILCMAAYEACGGSGLDIVPYAAALECIHTYSLIHDDLPAMDNDDLRRGKPTNHKVFGEGMAILAGDGLLTEAFSILSSRHHEGRSPFPHTAVLQVIHEVATASGGLGMVAGQAQDLVSEDQEPDASVLSFIHRHKTASLITASVRTGAILACCSGNELSLITRYGESVGLAFQIVDDILDVMGETEVIGKPKGSDERKKKMTYPRLYGIEESQRKARELASDALDALSLFDESADPLRDIARYLVDRTS